MLGGGPAGAAAALSLKQADPTLQVLLAEAAGYDDPRAGETLAPGGLAVLEALGCGQRFRQSGCLESYCAAACWGGSAIHQNEFLLSGRGSAWHLDRPRFDAMLADCARDTGMTVRRARFLDATREAGKWRPRLRTDREILSVAASFVIDGTGRGARFATGQGARRLTEDRLAAVAGIYRFPDRSAPQDRDTLVEASEHGWWYSAPLPGSRRVVAWMSDTDLIRASRVRGPARWTRHLAMSGPTAERAACGEPEAAPRIWAGCRQRLSVVRGEAWVAAGDAACTWDPLSSAAILKALRTGRLAAFVALDHVSSKPDRADRYARLVRDEHAGYRQAHAWHYGREQRWPDSPFWARGRSSG